MAVMNFMPCPQITLASSPITPRFGPVAAPVCGLTRLFHLEALVLLVDRTGKACAGCFEQLHPFFGIKALCWEHRDEILGTQFRRITEVQTMIEILQGIVTAYVISIPGRIRAAGGDGINNSVRVNAEFALRSHHGTCSCAPMDHQMGLIIKRSFSLGE